MSSSEPEPDLDAGTIEERLDRHLEQRSETLAWYHALGALLASVQADAAYGEGWQEQITDLYKVRRDTVYQAIKFARLFTADEVRQWEGRICWNKLRLVLSVGRRRRRLALLRAAVKDKLSDRALSAAVGVVGASHLPRGGPPRTLPPSKGRARDVAEYSRRVQRVLDHNAVVFARSVHGTVDALWARRGTISTKLREQLEALQSSATALSGVMTATASSLSSLLTALDEEHPDDEIDVS